jgi:biopolymer transport protein ExbD
MPEIKNRKKSSPQLDMNPMVDMAFLLVTFFLLATTFKTSEPTKIILPKSISVLELSEKDVISIIINRAGEVFIGIDNPEARSRFINRFSDHFEIELSEKEKETFTLLSGVGIGAKELPTLLSMTQEERNVYKQPGIPRDSLNNELEDWIILSRIVMPRARVAIKADKRAFYQDVEDIIELLKKNNILRFNLVTETRRIDGI